MRLNFLPQERIFYELFKQDIANISAGTVALVDMVRNYQGVKAKAAHIADLEHDGDKITHEIFRRLNISFVTPIEREDIVALASILDSVLDLVEEIAAMLVLYNVRVPSVYLLEASTLLVDAVDQLRYAIDGLEDLKGLDKFWIEVHRIENEGDVLYRNAISELFSKDVYEPLEVIKWNRLYDLMEKAFDKCEDVANVIENLVIKNA
jgi:predicted phosphate transport protein (TIGR00153 family)